MAFATIVILLLPLAKGPIKLAALTLPEKLPVPVMLAPVDVTTTLLAPVTAIATLAFATIVILLLPFANVPTMLAALTLPEKLPVPAMLTPVPVIVSVVLPTAATVTLPFAVAMFTLLLPLEIAAPPPAEIQLKLPVPSVLNT